MQNSDKDRILNFLLGNESIDEFESWVYNDLDLEERVDGKLYSELIGINYNDKSVLHNLNRIIVGNYISQDDFENFKYKTVLLSAGWSQNRKIQVDLSSVSNTSEIQNAIKIIEEFGGLKFVSSRQNKDETFTLVEFLKEPHKSHDMSKYGLNKNLALFATAHNDHIVLFVDENNNFYQLDTVVSEHLYQFKGHDFKHMMRQLLKLEDEDGFEKV